MSVDRRQLAKFLPDHESIRRFERALNSVDAADSSIAQLTADVSALEADLVAAQAEIDAHEALNAAHGVTGDIVGTTDTQTLSNKTLSAAVLGGVTDVAGGRLMFPATQAASSDPNTLDDYEEGTWTPVVSAASGSITSYAATGYYTKVGRLINATLDITITNAGTGSGALSATLPVSAGVFPAMGCGRESVNTGSSLSAEVLSGLPGSVVVRTYNNGSPIATNSRVMVNIAYCV